MKSIVLLTILFFSVQLHAQSLKDALYSGKLKSDTGTVVRKTDDLSTKIDTAKKKPIENKTIANSPAAGDSSATGIANPSDSGTATGSIATADAPKDNKKYGRSMRIR